MFTFFSQGGNFSWCPSGLNNVIESACLCFTNQLICVKKDKRETLLEINLKSNNSASGVYVVCVVKERHVPIQLIFYPNSPPFKKPCLSNLEIRVSCGTTLKKSQKSGWVTSVCLSLLIIAVTSSQKATRLVEKQFVSNIAMLPVLDHLCDVNLNRNRII